MSKYVDIIGNKYNKLTVVSIHSRTRNGLERFVCKCDCGNTCDVLKSHITNGNTKSCGCISTSRVGDGHQQWGGYGCISGNVWNSIMRGANGEKGRSKLEFNITIKYAWDLFVKQDSRCALSDIGLSFPRRSGDRTSTASLDRINSNKGYIKGNVQWVHKDVNLMKNKLDQDYFVKMCSRIHNNDRLQK